MPRFEIFGDAERKEVNDTLRLDSKSDGYISKNISCLIKRSRTDNKAKERASNMVKAIL
ncbi:MAG: hypothetical protein L3J08_07815 [Flavobacteriaceae bacterium]|nr:hypothetical protein [Flavobacteriaceae bacterium]